MTLQSIGVIVKQIAVAADQQLNTFLFFLPGGAWADETLSARTWRCREMRPFTFMRPAIDRLFYLLIRQTEHCQKAYEAERKRMQSPPQLRVKNLNQPAE